MGKNEIAVYILSAGNYIFLRMWAKKIVSWAYLLEPRNLKEKKTSLKHRTPGNTPNR